MSSPGSRVPFPLRLAVRLLPEEVREEVLGDLIEHWNLRVSDQHWLARVTWAWRQPLSILAARLRFSRRSDERRGIADGRNIGVGVSWLDVKLGFRMLIKYPGLTLVGGLAMAFAIWVGATAFEALQQVVRPNLPLDEGDRIVEIAVWDAASNRREPRLTHDFLAWRQELRSVEDLVAFRTSERNLIIGEALGYPLTTAEISPSAFRLTRVPPLHGRFLIEDDDRLDAPPVLVLGYETWQTSFGADAAVVGQTVRLGAQQTTIVGVMPEGFAFPSNHRAWTPLRLDPVASGRREGAGIQVLGRLAPGASLEEAGTEMSTLVESAALEFPRTDQYLRVNVELLGRLDIGAIASVGLAFNLLPVLLLVLICANVALLMIARAATRESELAVRSALGAARGRIVGQLFVEALVLGGVAAAVGLAATGFGLRWVIAVVEAEVLGRPVPFWISDQISTATIVYAVALTVLGALVTGVAPALKVTRNLGGDLKQATPGGGGMEFGGVWTAVIVIQVAATVVLPFVAFAVVREGLDKRNYEVAFADEEFLGVQIRMDQQASTTEPGDTTVAAFLVRYTTAFEELEQRVAEDPNVLGVTYAERLPRTYHGWNQVEVDGGAVPIEDPRGHRVGRPAVDVDYFDVLGAPILLGRGFTLADLESGARVVIVDQPFVDRVLGGADPIGRLVRYVASERSPEPTSDGPWYEIIGLAPDLGVRCGWGYGGVYHPTQPGASYPLQMFMHLRGDPEAFAPRVRAAATLVDPTVRLYDPLPLDESTRYSEDALYDFWGRLAILVSGIVLLLSLATIYSVMSFTVVRRTREIGVRVALGGRGPRVVGAILKRPLTQVGAGIALGVLLTAGFSGTLGGTSAREVAGLAVYGLVMICVCAMSCIVPTHRALAVEPTEALRADG